MLNKTVYEWIGVNSHSMSWPAGTGPGLYKLVVPLANSPTMHSRLVHIDPNQSVFFIVCCTADSIVFSTAVCLVCGPADCTHPCPSVTVCDTGGS